MSWDPSTAATTRPSDIGLAAWSQCSRFIAVVEDFTIATCILDSVTLQRLQTLEFPQGTSSLYGALTFSPDGRMLTCLASGVLPDEQSLVSWDLQTGGIVSVITPQGLSERAMQGSSIVYSTDGKVVGVFYRSRDATIILTYDVVSGIHIHSHLFGDPFSVSELPPGDGSLSDDIPFLEDIWTHEESIRFAMVKPTAATIIIWEFGFTSGVPPAEIETLSIPDNFHSLLHANNFGGFKNQARLLPTLCRLAIAHNGGVMVWDTRNSKSLLSHTDIGRSSAQMSFSSDGRFFACSAHGLGVCLWEESPAGYTLRGTFASGAGRSGPLLSPNGESIIAFSGCTIQLWHARSFTTASSTPSTRAHQPTTDFMLDFCPDRVLAVVARREDNMVTVLDLRSGVPWLVIDAGMEAYGIRVTRNAVVVAGRGKVVFWNLPVGDRISNARASTKDSSRTTNFISRPEDNVVAASISPDVQYVALKTIDLWLYIYSASTGEFLGHSLTNGNNQWFTPDGCGAWCARSFSLGAQLWTEGSFRGHQTTSTEWVLGPGGKRLLMLPPPWQSYPMGRVWDGRFLALLNGTLSEPVILELYS